MPSSVPAVQLTRKQWGIVLLICAVQFVNILDFVIVMPLGPDFASSTPSALASSATAL